MSRSFLLSEKYKAFLRHGAKLEVCEGTTFAGKTTVGAVKLMLKAAESPKKNHIIAGLDIGTVEKNIVNAEYGILKMFGRYAVYKGNGDAANKMAHIRYDAGGGNVKIIYILGYGDASRWKKALGGQVGCVMIDEANTAHIDFLREAAMRCDYCLMTLNPDAPTLPVYDEYINRCRPLDGYAADTPSELLKQLDKPPMPGWTHWFFCFDDNLGCSEEKKRQLIDETPKGTKLYKNKILGLRGRATGLIFDLAPEMTLSRTALHALVKTGDVKFTRFSCGVDTSYSERSTDTFAFIFSGFTDDRKKITLAEKVFNNADRRKAGQKPLSPSDIPPLLFGFLEKNREEWGFGRDVFIDSADSGTVLECRKFKRETGCVYNFNEAWKKTPVIDRLNLQRGWLQNGYFFVLDDLAEHIREYDRYSWKEDKDEPEDANDHTINADQYSWLPFRGRIGKGK
jgi:PBSX family phage terminase large subunit